MWTIDRADTWILVNKRSKNMGMCMCCISSSFNLKEFKKNIAKSRAEESFPSSAGKLSQIASESFFQIKYGSVMSIHIVAV